MSYTLSNEKKHQGSVKIFSAYTYATLLHDPAIMALVSMVERQVGVHRFGVFSCYTEYIIICKRFDHRI